MGPRTMSRPPKYVQGFVDRHGKPRYYLRRSGHKSVPLPGLPWTPAFMAAYQAAMEDAPCVEIGASRTKPGTVAAAVVSYFNSCVPKSCRRNTAHPKEHSRALSGAARRQAHSATAARSH